MLNENEKFDNNLPDLKIEDDPLNVILEKNIINILEIKGESLDNKEILNFESKNDDNLNKIDEEKYLIEKHRIEDIAENKEFELILEVDNKEVIIIQEQKSSIFNSKISMNILNSNKSEIDNFYEQNNNFLGVINGYDENYPNISSQGQFHDYLNEDRIELNRKSTSKITIPLTEKPSKRKKNNNILKREFDNQIAHIKDENIEKDEENSKLIIEESKFPYKPLNKEKEEKFSKLCDEYILKIIF